MRLPAVAAAGNAGGGVAESSPGVACWRLTSEHYRWRDSVNLLCALSGLKPDRRTVVAAY